MEKTGKENINAVSKATMSFAEDVARAASGFLGGIADSMKESGREDKPSSKED